MDRPSREIVRLFGAFAGLYALSAGALVVVGIPIIPPWGFIVWIGVLVLPYAYCLTRILDLLDSAPQPLPSAVLVTLGVVALWLLPGSSRIVALVPAMLCLGVALGRFPHARRAPLRVTFAAIGTMIVGFIVLWNLNFLLGSAVVDLHDEAMHGLDLALYGWLGDVGHDHLYPLVRSRVLFTLLEKAYDMLPVELFLAPLVLAARGRDPITFVRTVFFSYFVGLVVFYVYPVLGPCITYPSTFDPAFFDGTRSHRLMTGMATQWTAVHARTAGSGLAYFVGLPSLHVALAVVTQYFLRASRSHFMAFLPINVLLVTATFVLGYHYFLDVPAGMLLAGVAIAVARDRPRQLVRVGTAPAALGASAVRDAHMAS